MCALALILQLELWSQFGPWDDVMTGDLWRQHWPMAHADDVGVSVYKVELLKDSHGQDSKSEQSIFL